MVNIRNLIAAISPDVYCQEFVDEGGRKTNLRKEVKKVAKEKGYGEAARIAKIVEQDQIFDVDFSREDNLKAPEPLKAPGIKAPIQSHKIIYDSPSESLEPIYFWILDYLGKTGNKVEKLIDNFVSAPGSAHFSELGMKATKMQEEAMKTLGAVNQVLKSILNIIYDLKEFRIRLDAYSKYEKGDSNEKRAALLALKQIWLDKVDINRGNSSIKGMAQQFDYVTLIDAFMAAETLDYVTKKSEDGGLDLNERVRRILQQRLMEFFKWIDQSKEELRKRYEIEKHYLRSQVSTIKLYSRWVKPYLKSAHQLEARLEPNAGLVTSFNTILLELILLAQKEYNPNDDIALGDLPELFKNASERKYYTILLVEFSFRGIPQRVGQGFSFGGRTEVVFTSFGLNNQELKALREEIDKDNVSDVLKLIEGATKESLDEIQKDIDEFLEEGKEKKAEEKKSDEEDVNPFSALFSFFRSEKKDKQESKDSKEIKPDTFYEKVMRSQAIVAGRDSCRSASETFKKSKGMPTL